MGHCVVVHRIGAALLLMANMATAPAAHAQPVLSPDAAIEAEIRARLAAPSNAHDRRLAQAVGRFYADRRFAAAWTNDTGFAMAGVQLQRAMSAAADDGLDPRAYALAVPSARTAAARAQADVQLSLTALRFAQDLGWGLTLPGNVHRDHAFVVRPFRGDSLLHAWQGASDAGRALLAVTPNAPGYARLRAALARLRDIERDGGWTPLASGPTLRRGATDPRVGPLRARLRERGDLEADVVEHPLFDEAVAAALARFQARHGLTADSVLGPATVAAFNVPVARRIRQVELGMERVRWLPAVDDGRWITVNLADQRAFVLDDGQTVFSTRVVIGTTNHKTPMFTDTITNIVLNPAWNVPPSIAAAEIIPRLRRDPSYLARNHMVRTGSGIQQLPGPWNALGQIAFMFPNRFNVYMHDTPAKELFASPDRAHSHGCIRVQRPHDLAALLLARDGWTSARLDSVIATGRRTVVWLAQPVPVRITYATAFVDNDGALQFRRDVYGRDQLLEAALSRR